MSWLITLSFVLSALQLGASPAAASGVTTAGSGFAVSSWSSGFSADTVGVAFQPLTGALFVTTENGKLWRIPAVGGAPVDLGTAGTNPRGIAFTPDGRLYIAIYGSGSAGTSGKVIEVDPVTGSFIRNVVLRDCAKGLASDAAGALMLTTCSTIRRIADPTASTPSDPPFAIAYDTDAIQVAPDGKIFVNGTVDATGAPCMPSCSNDRQQIWQVAPASAATVAVIPGTRGLAVVGPAVPATGHPKFVFANTTSGAIVKRNTDSGATLDAVTGGDPGWFMTLGPDGCLYATHGKEIVRVAKGDLSCDLETAGEASALLSLDPTTVLTPNVGTPITVTATLTGVTSDPGTTGPSFTVTGVNPAAGTGSLVSSGGGTAKWSFTYTGANVGPDTVVATMAYGGSLTSNPVTVTWQPPPDTTPPTVRAKILSASAPTSPCAVGSAFVDFLSTLTGPTCGFYTTAPTVVWEVVESTPGSPFLDTNPPGCPPFVVNFPTSPAGQPVTCSATSQGGSTDKTIVLQVALVEPKITVVATTPSGPYTASTDTNQNVTVQFLCVASYGPPFMTCDAGPGATYSAAVAVPLPLPHFAVTATRTFTTSGIFNVTGTVIDQAGRSDTATFGPIRIDQTAPVVTGTVDPAANTAGWHKADVVVSWACVDGAGPVLTGCTVTAPATQIVTTEGVNALTKNATDGVGNVGTGALTVKLDKTRPTIVATATANGVPYLGALTKYDVVVSYTCADAGSGLAAPCPSPVTLTADNATTTPVTIFDNAGNESLPASFGPTNIDKNAPAITAAVDRVPNSFGWYDAPVTIDFTCVGTHRGLGDIASCPANAILSGDGAGQSATGTATDNAGNTSSATFPGINIDQADPTIGFTITPTPTTFGWRNQPAVVTFDCADPLSGIATCTTPVTLGEGADQTATGSAADKAGNTATVTAANIDVDLTKPAIVALPDRLPNGDGWYDASVSVAFSCTDALSGIDVCPATATRGHGGAQLVSGTARDRAGNEQSDSTTVNVDTVKPTLSAFSPVGDPADGGRFALQAVITITGADDLSGVKSVAFRTQTEPYADPGKTVLGPALPWSAWTTVSTPTTTVPWTAEGRTTFEIAVTDRAGNVLTTPRPITIVHVIATATAITSVRTLAAGTIEVTAKVSYFFSPLLTVPAGKQVVFGTSTPGATVSALTTASGTATAVLTRSPGVYTVTAMFPEQMPYLTSAGTKSNAVAAQATTFVIWGGNPGGVTVGPRVQFWGSDWRKQILNKKDPSYGAAGSFKGFAETVTATGWTAKTGSAQWDGDDDAGHCADDDHDDDDCRVGGKTKVKDMKLGSYITVLISNQISKKGSVISGNVTGYAVLKVEPGKKFPRLGERGFGTVVAVGP